MLRLWWFSVLVFCSCSHAHRTLAPDWSLIGAAERQVRSPEGHSSAEPSCDVGESYEVRCSSPFSGPSFVRAKLTPRPQVQGWNWNRPLAATHETKRDLNGDERRSLRDLIVHSQFWTLNSDSDLLAPPDVEDGTDWLFLGCRDGEKRVFYLRNPDASRKPEQKAFHSLGVQFLRLAGMPEKDC